MYLWNENMATDFVELEVKLKYMYSYTHLL